VFEGCCSSSCPRGMTSITPKMRWSHFDWTVRSNVDPGLIRSNMIKGEPAYHLHHFGNLDSSTVTID
jgi:hypothetical protein